MARKADLGKALDWNNELTEGLKQTTLSCWVPPQRDVEATKEQPSGGGDRQSNMWTKTLSKLERVLAGWKCKSQISGDKKQDCIVSCPFSLTMAAR